jgi:hypothetical protein
MANVYSADSLGIKAPSGGFAQGGWYSGRQYYNGTLSDPGAIHPESVQQGAGQAVSQEVVAQTNSNNNQYIQQQQQQAAAKPTAPVANIQPTQQQTQVTAAGNGTTGMSQITTQPAIDLTKTYNDLYSSAGIKDLEDQISQKQKALTDAQAKINDNPWLSEATRTGRLAKLQDNYNKDTANTISDIATKKADVETQLNLQMKQFDINSTQAQQALSQFNTLLGMGALDNAGGEDIANITRSTGISSNMIQSAIKARQTKDVKTQMITSTNDSGVVTATVINSETGEVIAKQNLGAIGNAQNGSVKQTEAEALQIVKDDLKNEIRNGATLDDVFTMGTGYLEPNLILQLYNANSPYGAAKETTSSLTKKYGVKF